MSRRRPRGALPHPAVQAVFVGRTGGLAERIRVEDFVDALSRTGSEDDRMSGARAPAVATWLPLPTVAAVLGHADLSTTAIYCTAVGVQARDLVARVWEAGTTRSYGGLHPISPRMSAERTTGSTGCRSEGRGSWHGIRGHHRKHQIPWGQP